MSNLAEVLGLEAPTEPASSGPERLRSNKPLDKWTREQLAREAGDEIPVDSEDALALEFVRDYGPGYRWSPGMGWMRDEGTHWASDDQLTRFDSARHVCRSAASRAGKHGRGLASARTVAAVITLAQSDPQIVLPAEAWDADSAQLNTPDGLINLRTGEWADRAHTYATQVTRVSPDADVACPAWLKFIGDVFKHDPPMINFVQRMLGYLLTGDRSEQKLFFWHGLGGNGKSVLADLLQRIFGSYGIKLPASVLMQASVERHPTELAQLRGKRLAISSELDEGQFWAESKIKELTGDEVLTARFMRQDFFEFRQTQTHVIVGNYKPRLRGGDAALARRFVLVPFTAKFDGASRDPGMLTKLWAEAPGILSWMVEGAVRWYEGGLCIPAQVSAASAEYMADNDDTNLWVEECCERSPDARAKASDLYESFAHWIKSRGQHAPSMRLWGDRMATMPGIGKVQSNGVRYTGLRLNLNEAERQLIANRESAR